MLQRRKWRLSRPHLRAAALPDRPTGRAAGHHIAMIVPDAEGTGKGSVCKNHDDRQSEGRGDIGQFTHEGQPLGAGGGEGAGSGGG